MTVLHPPSSLRLLSSLLDTSTRLALSLPGSLMPVAKRKPSQHAPSPGLGSQVRHITRSPTSIPQPSGIRVPPSFRSSTVSPLMSLLRTARSGLVETDKVVNQDLPKVAILSTTGTPLLAAHPLVLEALPAEARPRLLSAVATVFLATMLSLSSPVTVTSLSLKMARLFSFPPIQRPR